MYYIKFFEKKDKYTYNYLAMNENEFLQEEFQFLDDIKNSSLYHHMLEVSDKINENEELILLAKERDHALEEADKESDKDNKHALLVKFNKLDNELKNHPLMVDYLQTYHTLHQLIAKLSSGLTKEVKPL